MAKNKSSSSRPRFKIISKTRFFIFIASIWLLICPTILMATKYPAMNKERPYIKVYVEKGDTLWDIAKRTLPRKTDIRDYIQEIKAINELETAQIKEGDILEVPLYP